MASLRKVRILEEEALRVEKRARDRARYLDSAVSQQNAEIKFFKTITYLLPRCPPCRRLVAVDRSSAMLKLAAEKYSHPKIEHKQLDLLGDVDEFVRQQGRFQRVYSFHMVHWIRDQHHAMQNIEKLLAPGGECLLLVERNLHFFDLFEAMMNSQRWAKYSHMVRDFVPPTRTITDTNSLRIYASNLAMCTSLLPLACEVFTFSTLRQWNREKQIEAFLSFNPVYPLLDNKEKHELLEFTTNFTDALYRDSSDQNNDKRMVFVIHAYKPRE